MKKLLHIALGIGFCLMFCFLAVGYAALNDELHVTGTVTYKYAQPPLDADDTVIDGEVGGMAVGLYIGYGESKDAAGINSVRFPLYRRIESDSSITYYSIIDTAKLGDKGLPEYREESDEYKEQVILCAISDQIYNEDKKMFLVIDSETEWRVEFDQEGDVWKDTAKTDFISFDLSSQYILYFKNTEEAKEQRDKGPWVLVETGSASNTPETTAFTLDTTAVTNLTIESQEAQTMDLSSRPNLLLTLTPAEGYLLPETFTVTISSTEYTISTVSGDETGTMLWEAETSTLYILGDILPTDGSPVVITAHAVPEIPGFTLNTDGLLHLTAQWYTANGCLNLSLTTEDGYLLPESLAVTINNIPYTVYTTSKGENPAGMGYDPIENILTIHFSLIPRDALIMLIGEAIPEPNEGETEPTEEVTDPTEETTESTEEPTDPTEETTEPTGEPTDPTEETTEPTEEPTGPTEDTTEPTEDPTVENTMPTEESTDPIEETSTPTEECTVSADDGADSEHH